MRQKAFTLVELLVVIAIIAVLLAILLPSLRNVKGMAQRLICKSKLKDIGTTVATYAEQYDGVMPRSDGYETGGIQLKHAYWALAIRGDLTQPTQYYGLGGLWKAGLIPDGKEFYCPATRNWLDEYKKYCDPTPWGTLPQNYNQVYGSGNEFLRAYKGFLFWPQTRDMLTQTERNTWPSSLGWINSLYKVGLPYSPYRHSDMSPSRALSVDCSPHMIQGSGFNVNALFGDNHVNLNLWPTSPTKKFYSPYLLTNDDWQIVADMEPPYNMGQYWAGGVQNIHHAEYFFKFQP
jgi:prepilin-type N-terminal cleavage/methylation domain-containing protein